MYIATGGRYSAYRREEKEFSLLLPAYTATLLLRGGESLAARLLTYPSIGCADVHTELVPTGDKNEKEKRDREKHCRGTTAARCSRSPMSYTLHARKTLFRS